MSVHGSEQDVSGLPKVAHAENSQGLVARTVTEEAVQFIRSLIHSGELGPGEKLPSERDLAAHLGVSRVTVRVALKALETSGYVTTRRGSQCGTFVSELRVLLDRWSEWMHQTNEELDDIFDLRIAVESRAAGLAAVRRTEEDLVAIETAVNNLGVTRAAFLRADAEFHRAVARAAHSSRLYRAVQMARGEFFQPVHHLTSDVWYPVMVDHVVREGRIEDTKTAHRAIFNAICDRNQLGASAAMEAHIEVTRVTMRAIYESIAKDYHRPSAKDG